MKPILGKIRTFASNQKQLSQLTVDRIRSSGGHEVKTYSQLISKLAQVAFANPEFVLLMRGQTRDYKEKSKTTLFPTMYRSKSSNDNLYADELKRRYAQLTTYETQLYRALRDTAYWDRVGRNDLARWAILQHYEVCPTPLLDVTHSALVACSFAFLDSRNVREKHVFLFVLGIPQINGSITVSPTHGMQVVRLSSVCPPETLRPYFQEGYLMGNYPTVDTLDEKMRYRRSEMDCAQRLIAKFKIPISDSFWDLGFQSLSESALYPEEQGELCSQLAQLKQGH